MRFFSRFSVPVALAPNTRNASFVAAASLTALATLTPFATPAAHAQSTVYTSQASFLAAVAPGYYTETFTTVIPNLGTSFDYSNNGFSYTVTSSGGIFGVYQSGNTIGANNSNTSVTFTFSSGNVTAVGGMFFQTNQDSIFQAEPVTLTLSDGTTQTFTPTSQADSYRGFTTAGNTVLTSLTFAAPDVNGLDLFATIDNLTVGRKIAGAEVPEPGSLALLGIGTLPLMGMIIRRRRK